VVTGSASGIGAATKQYLESRKYKVIGVDRHSADVIVDLASTQGREDLIAQVLRLAPSGIDAVVANAGVNLPDVLTLQVNFFGGVATLEGLRPLLRRQSPRAVLVASRVVLQPVVDDIVEACLAGDEELAVRLGDALPAELKARLYASSKLAAARWLRRVAGSDAWAAAGIPLNAVAPGSVDTPMIGHRNSDELARTLRERPMPLGGLAKPHEVAAVISWLLEPDNTKVTGQMIFVDGGGETLMRREDIWSGTVR
jgi:NAD(P)-dependent dehydrogenase (short-subunit alcohol dehydrogenase family)